jgi:hypothetical protein
VTSRETSRVSSRADIHTPAPRQRNGSAGGDLSDELVGTVSGPTR